MAIERKPSEMVGDLNRAIDRVAVGIRGRIPVAVDNASALLEGAIKEELSTPGTGRVYVSRAVRARVDKRTGRKTRGLSRDAKALLGGAQGPISPFGAGKKLHRASSPGDPPAADIGELRRSVGRKPVGPDEVEVGPQTRGKVAAALELGTNRAGRGGLTKIAPRPFMAPALARVRSKMDDGVVADMKVITIDPGVG
jgi:hypothetical protein